MIVHYKNTSTSDRIVLTHPYTAGFHPQEILPKGKAHQRESMVDLSAVEGPSSFCTRHKY
jgi:hypothetical protein